MAKPGLDRKISFGGHPGEPVWQDVPGEYRAPPRRLIVTQGDTEPASVEQQRHLGLTCPSLYDLLKHCQDSPARCRYPRWVNFVDDLPKTATGKIQRFKPRPD